MCQTEGSCSRAAEVPRDGARPPVSPAFSGIVPPGPQSMCSRWMQDNNHDNFRGKFEFWTNSSFS